MPSNIVDINVSLVSRLVAAQFPQWADLPIWPVEFDGWDNRTFRLGEGMAVQLPSAERYTQQVEKEHHWLPRLALFPASTNTCPSGNGDALNRNTGEIAKEKDVSPMSSNELESSGDEYFANGNVHMASREL